MDLVVDLSNVCRDMRLKPAGGEASWDRLSLLLDAIHAKRTVEYRGYYLVADKSLLQHLDEVGRRKLRAAESDGTLELCGFADERLVELAFGSTSPFENPLLVTNDFLDDFRRTYPELNVAEAITWDANANGTPIPLLKPFGERTHYRISMKEEEGELRRRRLLRRSVQDDAAHWYYTCTERGCMIAAFWPEHLEELPKYDSDQKRFVCPGCSSPLTRGKARPPSIQVIVYHSSREIARLLVEDGIKIGRVDATGTIGLERFLPPAAVEGVSRDHLQIWVDGDQVLLEDLNSKNGTSLARRHSPDKRIGLTPSRRVAWEIRDAVELPHGVRLERSGRRLHFSGDQPLEELGSPAKSSETRLIKPETP